MARENPWQCGESSGPTDDGWVACDATIEFEGRTHEVLAIRWPDEETMDVVLKGRDRAIRFKGLKFEGFLLDRRTAPPAPGEGADTGRIGPAEETGR
jgi:hypothetical protein